MPTVFPAASVPAGTPIILAPRVPQLSSVTSSLPSATMLTCRPPSVALAADAAAVATGSVIYPVDPYVQQVLEYSTGLQRTAAGCVQSVVRTRVLCRIACICRLSFFMARHGPRPPTLICRLWHATQACSSFLLSAVWYTDSSNNSSN